MSVNREMMVAAKGTIEKSLDRVIPILAQKKIGKEAFERMALNAIIANPDIAKCTSSSLSAALVRCADTGLMPDGQQAAIVPYKGKASFIPMVGGLVDLARRSIKGIAINYDVIYAGEEYVDIRGIDPEFWHQPDPAKRRMGWDNIVAAYAVAWMPGNAKPEYVIVYKDELEGLRKEAKTQNVWNKWPSRMAIKSALRRLCGKLPVRGNAHLFDDYHAPEEQPQDEAPAAQPLNVTSIEPAEQAQEPAPAEAPAPSRRRPARQRTPAKEQQAPPPEEEPAPEQQEDSGEPGDWGDDVGF